MAAQLVHDDKMWFLWARICLGHVQALGFTPLLGRDSEHRTVVMCPQFPGNSMFSYAALFCKELGWGICSNVLLALS